MITIKNRIRSFSVENERILSVVQEILKIVRYEEFDIGILITTNKTIRQYNKQFRNKDKATDILSFSYHQGLTPGKRIRAHTEDDKNLGDLIISLEYVHSDARAKKISPEERLKVLLVHGICHLLGYDHETDSDWRSMRAKEAFVLNKIKELSLL
ncbi:rRNA maturation RNase YbeY [Candidatus Dependentiae bacterium]|nr:rRNA maturation RNase YbeY [Candidatus Dependentiae bacterium]